MMHLNGRYGYYNRVLLQLEIEKCTFAKEKRKTTARRNVAVVDSDVSGETAYRCFLKNPHTLSNNTHPVYTHTDIQYAPETYILLDTRTYLCGRGVHARVWPDGLVCFNSPGPLGHTPKTPLARRRQLRQRRQGCAQRLCKRMWHAREQLGAIGVGTQQGGSGERGGGRAGMAA